MKLTQSNVRRPSGMGGDIKCLQDISVANIKKCCQHWQQTSTEFSVLALLAEADADKLPTIQLAFNSLDIALMGAIFPALVHESKFLSTGVLLVCLPQKPLWRLQTEIPTEQDALEDCLNTIIQDLSSGLDQPEDMSLFMILDAMLPNIATILDELYAELGDSVHYMGVNAGSETFQPMPCLFDNEQVISNGLLAILFPSHKGALLEHGYEVSQNTISATSATGNRVTTIDWKPAFDVYRERVQQQYGVGINKENFYELAVHFPFGIIRADGEVLVRIPVALDDNNSLICVGEIPENSILTLLEAPKAKSLHTIDQLADKLDHHPVNMLFYCAGRRMHLSDAADDELKDFQKRLGDRINAGALSLGEIGSSQKGGYPLFHNATLVSFPL